MSELQKCRWCGCLRASDQMTDNRCCPGLCDERFEVHCVDVSDKIRDYRISKGELERPQDLRSFPCVIKPLEES
ncbi:hypothetical protein UFOVP558_61 [uncultured Caudovirales phage]|uniref:Uncharacterized protein n=1 Tax=uncultured Caudovirales phage TaxID=2100421 RepID=A0A6J5MT33_9CAUD|nr:hypothetical protein UFOVP558_61 [uncultured Caudovirales phage]